MDDYFGNVLTLREVLKHLAMGVVSEMWARTLFYLFYSKDSLMFYVFIRLVILLSYVIVIPLFGYECVFLDVEPFTWSQPGSN